MDKSDRGGASILARFAGFGRFLRHAVRRYRRDNGLQVAAALSYSTLLAIVPLAAITLALISALPALDEVRADLLFDIYSNVLPQTQTEIAQHFEDLVGNAENMTIYGLIGLAVMVLLLFSTVVQTLNRIWRVTRPRPFLLQFSIYLSLLIFGPILFGASLTLTSYLFAIAEERGYTEYAEYATYATRLPGITYAVPLVLAWIGYTVVYFLVPYTSVRLRDAAAGGLIAAVLFEILKNGFGFYVSYVPTYQTIYGALAAIPILLIWLHAAWTTLIIGAEVAATLGLLDRRRTSRPPPG
jgi:membrane protein